MAGKVRINGTIGAISSPLEIEFDPVRGLIMHGHYRSAGDNLGGWANIFMNEGVAFRWKKSAHISEIDATFSGGQLGLPDLVQPNWQILGNEIQKSIFESGIALSGLATFPSLIADVKAGFAFIEEGDSAGEAAFSDTLSDGELVYYDQLIDFLARGQTHFAHGQYVLKRTLSVSNFYSEELPGEGNVEALLLMDAVLSLGMPPVMAAKLGSIPIPGSHTGYQWSWRQLPSTMTTSAQNRVEVSTEWWWEEWSTNLYPLA